MDGITVIFFGYLHAGVIRRMQGAQPSYNTWIHATYSYIFYASFNWEFYYQMNWMRGLRSVVFAMLRTFLRGFWKDLCDLKMATMVFIWRFYGFLAYKSLWRFAEKKLNKRWN